MRHLPNRPVYFLILALVCILGVPAAATTRNVTTYGAVGNGTSDDTAAIRSAIAALVSGDTLLFPCVSANTYKITSQLVVNVSNVIIDGSSCARILSTGGLSSSMFRLGQGGFGNTNASLGTKVPLSTTANELTSSFQTTSSLGASVGSLVYVQQGGRDSSTGSGDTGCDMSGCRAEILQVASVSGNIITVSTALHDTYNPSVNLATAQLVRSPLSNITVRNITFDGNSTNQNGLEVNSCLNCTITGVTAKNVTGAGIISSVAYGVTWENITITQAGSAGCGDAMHLFVQGNTLGNNISLSNLNTAASSCLGNGAFGFGLSAVANSTFTNLTVHGSPQGGRPFKTIAARYTTFNGLKVDNGAPGFNGVSLEYYSSHNTFNNCVVTNNGGTATSNGNAGINLFGNFNQYNTFNNCTVTGNGNVQFFQGGDYSGLYQDTHVTISGGTFKGSNSAQPVIYLQGDSPYVTGASISGPGPWGIYVSSRAGHACVNNNVFSGLSSDINYSSTNGLFNGNSTPDGNNPSSLPSGSCPAGLVQPPSSLAAIVN